MHHIKPDRTADARRFPEKWGTGTERTAKCACRNAAGVIP
jgi:hypothetical protein